LISGGSFSAWVGKSRGSCGDGGSFKVIPGGTLIGMGGSSDGDGGSSALIPDGCLSKWGGEFLGGGGFGRDDSFSSRLIHNIKFSFNNKKNNFAYKNLMS
jgi:hypothetical protein